MRRKVPRPRTPDTGVEAGKAGAFVDPAGCKAFYGTAEAAFRAELKKQNP